MVRLLRIPAALPALVTGIRLAAVYAPVGALIGEWVGASSGLGYAMLFANGRAQTDVVFAALLLLAAMSVLLRAVVDLLTANLTPWAPETAEHEEGHCHESPLARCCRACRRSLASPALAADKLTVLLDWFVNPDHAPLVIAKEGGYFARARPRRRPDRAGRSERAAAPGRRRAGRTSPSPTSPT